MLGCMCALLLAGANAKLIDKDGRPFQQQAEVKGQPTTKPSEQHAAPAFAAPAPPDAGEPEGAGGASLLLDIRIHQSAERGELEKVASWLREGGPIDALCSWPMPDGETVTSTLLQAAARNGQPEMARMLLKQGASVDLRGDLGNTALMTAAYQGHLFIVRLLLQYSANPDLQGSDSRNALMTAAYQGHFSIVRLLLQHSANLDLQANDGRSALMMAAQQGHEACVKRLLRSKANTELLDKEGLSALQHAEKYRRQPYFDSPESMGHTAIVQLIRQHAATEQPAVPSPTAVPDTGEPAMNSPAPLASEIVMVDVRGEVQKMDVRGEVQKAEVARHDFLQSVEARAKAEAFSLRLRRANAMN